MVTLSTARPATRPALQPPLLPRLPSGALALTVAEGAHPEQATHVRTETFDGPLALLLSLIEQRQLDILQVPLGELAGAYLEALATLDEDQLPHISAFIAIASQLILIKSRALLPREPVPDPAAEEGSDPEELLRQRLIEYRRYRDAAALLAALLGTGRRMAHREVAVAVASARAGAVAPPPRPMHPDSLVRALGRWVQIALPLDEPPAVVPRTVTLADRARVIREALRDAPALVLQELLAGVRDRVVVAVTFLALLELAKGRELVIEQAEPWGPIAVRRADPHRRLEPDAPLPDDDDDDGMDA
ncbi:MAG: segregation/condensation protein A [Chloroflexi bacterium]|nr:segregation/condensation protein A [Chloroflexota bacterium]